MYLPLNTLPYRRRVSTTRHLFLRSGSKDQNSAGTFAGLSSPRAKPGRKQMEIKMGH